MSDTFAPGMPIDDVAADLLEQLGVASSTITKFIAASERRRYRKGETLFHAGDSVDDTYLVCGGSVLLQKGCPNGGVLNVGVRVSGMFLNSATAFRSEVRSPSSALAAEATLTRRIRLAALMPLVQSDSTLVIALARGVVEHDQSLADRLVGACCSRVETRIWNAVSELAKSYRSCGRTSIPLTHEQLANYAGVSRPTMTSMLQKFVCEGKVAVERGAIAVI